MLPLLLFLIFIAAFEIFMFSFLKSFRRDSGFIDKRFSVMDPYLKAAIEYEQKHPEIVPKKRYFFF